MWIGWSVAALLFSGDVGSSAGVAAAPPPECGAVVSLLDAQYAMFFAFREGDAGGLATGIEALPGLVAEVRATPPSEVAADVDEWLANADDTLAALVGASSPEDVLATLSSMPPPALEFTAAQQHVEEWAAVRCGWSAPGPSTGPDGADCRALDAAAAARAAGLDVDPTHPDVLDGTGPVFTTQACSYGSGALVLTAISFEDRDEAAELMVAMATTVGGGEVVATDVGVLPDSTVVIRFAEATQVLALDAATPFAVTLSGPSVDPATAVVCAEAVLVSMVLGGPDVSAPPTSTR